MNGGQGTSSALITLVVAAVVVVRFLFRELRERTIRLRTLWLRPGIVAVAAVALVVVALISPRTDRAILALACIGGAVVGVVAGLLVVRATTFRPAGERGAVLAHGSVTSVIVWIVALVLRYAARFAFAGSGASPAEQVELNAGLLALLTAAFVVVALAFHRAIDRLAPEREETQTL
jgi:hypothetical protein